MKHLSKLGLALLLLGFAFACKQADYATNEAEAKMETADSTSVISSNAAVEPKIPIENLLERLTLNLK